MGDFYNARIAVLCFDTVCDTYHLTLAKHLGLDCLNEQDKQLFNSYDFFLSWRNERLNLLDHDVLKKGGLYVDIEPRPGEQRSFPCAREGSLAQALGRKTQSIIDATAGWGQDSFYMLRMGYVVTCIERSPIMAALLEDGLRRLKYQPWIQKQAIKPPDLFQGNASEILANMTTADCIYLDPMFPPKRKKSALSKKSMQILHQLVGADEDKQSLFDAAMAYAGKRVVVKSPDYAPPLGGRPSLSFGSKLLRYDVYLKG